MNVYDLLIILRISLALLATYWTWSLNVKHLSTFPFVSWPPAKVVLLTWHHLDGIRTYILFTKVHHFVFLCIESQLSFF